MAGFGFGVAPASHPALREAPVGEFCGLMINSSLLRMRAVVPPRVGPGLHGGHFAMSVTVYHNPACGTSRKTLALLEGMGHAPRVVEYLKTPPTRSELKAILKAMGVGPRAILREKGAPYAELGLGDPALSDEALIDAMLQHPILINRPIVVTDKGARLCRPPETVLEILPAGAT